MQKSKRFRTGGLESGLESRGGVHTSDRGALAHDALTVGHALELVVLQSFQEGESICLHLGFKGPPKPKGLGFRA